MNYKRLFIIILFTAYSSSLLSQPPCGRPPCGGGGGGGPGGGNGNGNCAACVPIDDGIEYLLLAGLILGAFYYKSSVKNEKGSFFY